MRRSRLAIGLGVIGLVLTCISPAAGAAQTGCDAPYGAGCPAGPGPSVTAAPAASPGLVSQAAGGAVLPVRAAPVAPAPVAPAPVAAAPLAADLAFTGSGTAWQTVVAAFAIALGGLLLRLGRERELGVT